MKQKTVVNANMWTPKQLVTTQTFFFCSTGDEDRLGGSLLTGETLSENHPLLGSGGYDDGDAEWEPILWDLATEESYQILTRKTSLLSFANARGVAFNNRFGWIRYSPAGFGKDASGYLMTKPTT